MAGGVRGLTAVEQDLCGAEVGRLVPLARGETEVVVREGRQPRPELQPVAASGAAAALAVGHQGEVRTRPDGARHARRAWLVEVRLEGARAQPWRRLTDRPATTAEEARAIRRMCRQGWPSEEAFESGKRRLGRADVRVRARAAVRTPVAPGWVAAGFLHAPGVAPGRAEVRRLARRGGGEPRAARPPGKLVPTRGLRRLLDHLATAAIPADEARRQGG